MLRNVFVSAASLFVVTTASASTTVAYWNQNSNDLSGGGFGFEVGDFPQTADNGSQAGFAVIRPSAGMLANVNAENEYQNVVSFGGTSIGALFGADSGGSLSIVGEAINGEFFDVAFDASDFVDLSISWAQRGTGTGFDSRTVSVSTDGVNFTQIYTDSGTLSSSWSLETAFDNGLLDNVPTAFFRFTLDGATSGAGNNRFDNLAITGTFSPLVVIPLPSAAGLVCAGIGIGAIRRRQR